MTTVVQVAATMLALAEAGTGLSAEGVKIGIVFMEECKLQLLTGKTCPPENGRYTRAAAQPGVVVLQEGWDPSNVYHQAIMLHELVHILQFHHEVPMACTNEWEAVAYEVHFDFLRSKGLDPYEVTGLDEMTVKLLTTCQF